MIEGRSTDFTGFGMMPAMITSTFEADDPRRRAWKRGEIRHLIRDCIARRAFPAEAGIDPETARAHERVTVTLSVTPTERAIESGGRVAVLLPQFWGGVVQERDPTTWHLWNCPGTYPGYISSHICWDAPDTSASIGGTITCCGSVHTVMDLLVEEGEIGVGDTLEIVIGDPRGLAPLAVELAGTYRFSVLVDADGSGDWARVAPEPSIRVTPGPASQLRVTLPACRDEPESDATVVALDDHLNLADPDPEASIESRSVGSARADVAHCPRTGIGGASNPSVEGPWIDDLRVYFGEIHSHGELSDGIGTIDDSYLFARDALGLDFAAKSDHFEHTQPTLYYPEDERWEMTRKAAERFHDPGTFVTLLGYEWGGNPHINVYYRGDHGGVYSARDEGSRTPTALWERLREQDLPVLTIPHHPKFLSAPDWSEHAPELQRLVEIYSGWGSSEEGSETTVRAALERGLRLGFVGGTDNHIGRPGQGNRTHEGCGLACVLAPALTREAIFDALMARRCYATSGARMLLDVRVNGALMGSEIEMVREREITVRAIGEGPIERIELIAAGEVIREEAAAGAHVNCEWSDTRDTPSYYYCRVTQRDGHVGWSSPVWVG